MPFGDAAFDLVTSRHPVNPDWAEITRVLVPGGTYLAQHVGSASAVELIEYFIGPYPAADDGPDFSVDRYAETLRRLDALIRAESLFVAHSTRHLIEAARQSPSSSTAR